MRHVFASFTSLILLVASTTTCMAQQSDGSFNRRGARIYYTSEGTGKVLILLAGGPGFEPSYLKPVEDKLAATRRCVLLEQRGTGRSKLKLSPQAFTVDQYVADLEQLRKTLKLSKLDILGHSWGGMLAMAYAAAYPNHIGKLILCDSGGPNGAFVQTSRDNETMRLQPDDWTEIKKWSSDDEFKKNPQLASDRLLRAFVPGYFYDRNKAATFQAVMLKAPKIVNLGVYQLVTRPEVMSKYNLVPKLRKVHCKTLVIMGKQDPMDESTGFLIRDTIRGSKLVLLERCGHFPWIEAPEPFWRDVRAFLSH